MLPSVERSVKPFAVSFAASHLTLGAPKQSGVAHFVSRARGAGGASLILRERDEDRANQKLRLVTLMLSGLKGLLSGAFAGLSR